MSRTLPALCATRLLSNNQPIVIVNGQSGYYPQSDEFKVDNFNKRHGASSIDVAAMEAGSMWGWNTKAADPNNYNEDGTIKKEVLIK